MAPAAGTGYLVNLIYYASIGTVKMVDLIPVPSLAELTSLMGRARFLVRFFGLGSDFWNVCLYFKFVSLFIKN